VQNDDDFVKSVYGYKALNILKTRFPKNYASRLSRTQVEEMKQNVICRLRKTREHSYGKALVNGRVVWSCRCEHVDCHAYEKCMSLPNAVRIDRSALPNFEQLAEFDSKHIDDLDHGFDHDECNFEPPHVAVVLPILNEILENSEHKGEVNEDIKEDVTAEETDKVKEAKEAFTSVVNKSSVPDPMLNISEIMPDLFETVDIAEVTAKASEAPDALEAFETIKAEETVQAPKYAEYQYTAEEFQAEPDKRILVICENLFDAGYLSSILYKNKVKHKALRLHESGYTLNRRIADVFWDYCGDIIEKDAFMDRCWVRVGCSDSELDELFESLFKLCGDEESGGLKVTELPDALNSKLDLISECILNMDDPDCPVTIATLDSLSVDEEYDEVMLLENTNTTLYSAVEELFGSPPLIIRKESTAGWAFNKSTLGRPCRVGLDNYTGEPGRTPLNVEMGLWGDVDGKSFLTEQVGDSISLQLYIAEKISEGDELTVEKDSDTGVYRFCHNGNALGEFPSAIIREVQLIDGFPDDFIGFEGIYVRNIVTCISEKNDMTVPPRFRESRIWLGLDITGYAKVLI
jgi:hypothetical protein